MGMEDTKGTTTEKQGLSKRISAFFEKNYAVIFAPLAVLVIFMAVIIQKGVYPFGKEWTLASYDLSAQICPFIEHVFDVIDGKSSVFYSYAIAGGADVFGTFAYFFLSPFSVLFLIFGDGMVAHTAWIVLAAKLMTIAAVGAWFAKKQFRNIPDYICVALGVAYAYCGYTFMSNTYINWMDFLIYMPLCVAAFRRFVTTGKFLRFSVLLAVCIYTCFSIACFSLFTVFPVLIFYALFCVEKEKRTRFIAYTVVAFAIAILIALPILFPALLAYTRSSRSAGGFFDVFWFGFHLDEKGLPISFNKKAYFERMNSVFGAKWTYVLMDTAFISLTLAWFVRKGLRDPFARFMLVAGVLTLIPVLSDEAMLLMNMGSYYSYPLRFGFLNAVYFFSGACLAVEDVCFTPHKAYDGTPLFPTLESLKQKNDGGRYVLKEKIGTHFKEKKSLWFWSGGLVVFALVVAGLLGVYITGENYLDFWKKIYKNESILKWFESNLTHSYGGLEVFVVFLVAVGLVTLFGGILAVKKKTTPALVSYILILVVAVQILFNNSVFVEGNLSNQHIAMGNYQTISAQLNERNEEFFRVKDYGKSVNSNRDGCWTANVPFTGDSNSFSVFSSVIDADNFEIMNLFGYRGGSNSLKSTHWKSTTENNGFGDAFLGYKYFIVYDQNTQLKDVENKSYMQKVMIADGAGAEKHLSDGKYYAYENTMVFPFAYTVPQGEFRFVKENSATYRSTNQVALYKFLSGEDFSGTSVTEEQVAALSKKLWQRAASIDVGAGKITASVTAKEGECLFLPFVASKGYSVTVNGRAAKLLDNDLHFLCVELNEGENVVKFTYESPYLKYAALGLAVSVVGLCAAAFVLKKTKLVEKLAPSLYGASIILTVCLVGFFMIFPCAVTLVKVCCLI